MVTLNASGVTCQLGNFCFEFVTLCTRFSVFKYSKYGYLLAMGMEMRGNANRDVEKV